MISKGLKIAFGTIYNKDCFSAYDYVSGCILPSRCLLSRADIYKKQIIPSAFIATCYEERALKLPAKGRAKSVI